MAKIVNLTRRPLTLVTLHVIPREGELVVTNDVILGADNWARINMLQKVGELTYELDPIDPGTEAATWTEVRDPHLPPLEMPLPPIEQVPAGPVVQPAPEVSPVEVTPAATDATETPANEIAVAAPKPTTKTSTKV